MLFSQDITVLLMDVKNSKILLFRVFYYSVFISLVFRQSIKNKKF